MTCYVISMVYTLWDLSGKYGFQWNERWYEHVLDSVLENEDYKTLWDFSIRADHMKLRLGDWIYWSLTKKRNNCNIIDVTITDNGRWKGASKRGWVLRKIPKSHKRNSKDVRCKDNDEQGSLGTFWRCRLSKSEVKGTCCWLLAGVDENCIWHLYLRVLAVIIIIINFINFFETGLQIGIAGFVANTGNI